MNDYILNGKDYCSVVIREKNQYRIFRYEPTTASNSVGYVGMQKIDQTGQGIEWGQLLGMNAYRASSTYVNEQEVILFANHDGFVYRMDVGSTFDGTAIVSRLHTPFMSVNDPTIRKTLYDVRTYFDSEGTFRGNLTPRYDFNDPNKIQPFTDTLDAGGDFTVYGEGVYGTSTYGGLPDTTVKTNFTGSFFTVSLQYEFGLDDQVSPPFTLDTILLSYSTEDRK
jgi:hypothetical protein